MHFTDSPYEKIMTQIPMGKRAADFCRPLSHPAIPAMAAHMARARHVSGCATGI